MTPSRRARHVAPRPTTRTRYRALVGLLALGSVVAGSLSAAQAQSGPTLDLSPGRSDSAVASSAAIADVSAIATFTVPSTDGGGVWLGVQMRSTGEGDSYRARARVMPDGELLVGFSRVTGGAEQLIVSEPTGRSVAAGDEIVVQGRVDGAVPHLRVRAWEAGSSRPGWQQQYVDRSSDRIADAGAVRAWGYLSSVADDGVEVPVEVGAVHRIHEPSDPSTPPTTTPTTPAPTPTTPAPTPTPTPAPEAPTTQITSGPGEGSTTGSTVRFAFSSETAGAGFVCQLDGGSARACTSPHELSGLAAGRHTFSVRATHEGRTDQSPATRSFTVAPPRQETGGFPTAATTGVPDGTRLQRRDGDIVVTEPGTRLENLDVHGFVIVRAPDVTIKNSIIRGGRATHATGLLTSTAPRLVVEDTSFQAANPSVHLDGVKGAGFTLRRVHVTGNVDSVKVQGDNVRIEDSLLENTTYYSSDPYQGGGPTHNDNVQIQNGTGHVIVGNTIRGSQNFAILGAASKGTTSGLVVRDNYLDGGHCTVKLEELGGNRLQADVRDNTFGPNRKVGCPLVATNGSEVAASGNVLERGGQPVTVQWVDS